MESLKYLWRFIDGHKTNTASFLATVYFIGGEYGIWVPNENIVEVLAMLFSLGLLHKGAKYVKRTA